MLLQILIQQPSAIGTILMQTPTWVWALLAGLIALGVSQLYSREVTLRRTTLLPLSMALLSLFGLVGALGNANALPTALALWALAAGCTTWAALMWRMAPPKGCRYDAATGRFLLPGSAVPLALILAIFLTKYAVGVELAMQPQHVHDSVFAHSLAAVYGFFNGILIARTARLWRLMKRATTPTAAIAV